MALTVDYIYEYARKLIKKNQSGNFTATDLKYFWNGESCAYMSDLLGRFQLRNNGKGGMNTGLIENETILQKLSPFTKNNPSITVTAGNATKPADLIYRLALRVGDVDAVKINQNQIATVKADLLGDAPSIANSKYYYVEYQGFYTMLPIATTSIVLDYIASPTDMIWGYTLDGNGRQVYNSATSVQTLWDDLSIREITERMLKKLGASLKDRDMESFGQSVINSGN